MPAGGEHLENIRAQIEAINYKLDTLKAVLDSLNSRLANIETALKASPLEKGEGWNY
jgi:prefoldin subunit 5